MMALVTIVRAIYKESISGVELSDTPIWAFTSQLATVGGSHHVG